MRVEYVLRDLNEAHADGWPGWSWRRSWSEPEALYEVIDGVPMRLLGVDGGEPEDQSFLRDWGWVPGALMDAYELGYQHGKENA